MAVVLADNNYGKQAVRLVTVRRRADRHELQDVTVGIRFEGDFTAAYADGDNSGVLPTDTMKNTVYALAAETEQIEEIEDVAWEELMPECLWKFRVKDFGPLTVAIDSHGNSLYHDVQQHARKRLEDLYARL
jgi:urate oxidase